MATRTPDAEPAPRADRPDKRADRADNNELVPGRVYPSAEALARYDRWLASEDPEFITALDKLDQIRD